MKTNTWWSRWQRYILFFVILAIIVISCPWFHEIVKGWFLFHPVATGLVLLGAGILVGQLIKQSERLGRDKLAQQVRDVSVIALVLVVVMGSGIFLVSAAPILAVESLRAAAFKALALWSLAFFAAGFLVGFLFGIPKALQGTSQQNGSANTTGNTSRRGLQINTNLEQISDWLTKIIVGVGLVELKAVPDYLHSMAKWVASCISYESGPAAAAISFSGSIIIFFSVVGFLAGYLITRLFLTGAFDRADPGDYQETVANFNQDQLGDRILAYWKPGGTVNPANEKCLKEWIMNNNIRPPLITALVSAAELQEARKKVIAQLNIP